jgi:phage baseplate assembly protein W
MAISIKFPFQESFNGGVFRYTTTTPEKVRTNLIALLTMKRQQRPMHNNLYSPLWDYIFEPWDEISADKLKTELLDKIATFIPEITTQDIIFTFDETTNVLTTKIVYSIIEFAGATDFVEIDVTIQNEL